MALPQSALARSGHIFHSFVFLVTIFVFLSLLIRLISIWALHRAGAHTMPANYANRDWIMSSAKPQIIIFPNSKVIIIVSGRCGFIDFESLPRFRNLSRRFSDDPRRSVWWNLRMIY